MEDSDKSIRIAKLPYVLWEVGNLVITRMTFGMVGVTKRPCVPWDVGNLVIDPTLHKITQITLRNDQLS